MKTGPLDERDQGILERKTLAWEAVSGPRVGDYVVFPDGSTNRFSHDWGDSMQTSPGGSWYLGDGYASFSGALDPTISKDLLTDTGATKPGMFWFFSHDYARAHNGIGVSVLCRVYEYSGPDKRFQV